MSARAEEVEPVWAVCVNEWNGDGYQERIVGPFATEAEAEMWVLDSGEVCTVLDLMPPSEWKVNRG